MNTSDPALHQEGVGTSDDAAHGGTPPCTCSPAVEWVQTPCTSLVCRGRRNGGQGFTTTVQRGQEAHALCNECFCR